MKKYSFHFYALCLSILLFFPLQVFSAADSKASFSQAELDQMVAPIALYPDSLLSQILMASTYPANVSEAVTWSKNNPKQQGDEAVKAVQEKSWDPSVMSLVAFPQVLEMMGKEPDWVQNLGDAFLASPDDVMNTVQSLRRKAKEEGNLETTKEQKIVIEQASPEIIIIEPADPKVVYVPVYNPTVVYGVWWWPAYTPYYYYPPRYGFGSAVVAGIGFGVGVAITNSLWGGCNWRRGDVDINVNRYNNINVNNNRINASNKTTNWTHNNNNRRTPYRDPASQKKYNKQLGDADKRKDYRGRDNRRDTQNALGNTTRDAERQRAQASLKKHGADPVAARKNLSGAGGDQVRNQVNKVDQNRGGLNKSSGLSNNTSRRDNSRTTNLSNNRSTSSSNRSNSLSGIRNQGKSSQNYNRGSRSRGSASRGGRGRR
ncbi:MAG: DUF3300 domain-containing protein [Gammaproteobacteria bacterium]|nr:DUF3300 domain-containing protein [Gammaproteobacteria bacterium]